MIKANGASLEWAGYEFGVRWGQITEQTDLADDYEEAHAMKEATPLKFRPCIVMRAVYHTGWEEAPPDETPID